MKKEEEIQQGKKRKERDREKGKEREGERKRERIKIDEKRKDSDMLKQKFPVWETVSVKPAKAVAGTSRGEPAI